MRALGGENSFAPIAFHFTLHAALGAHDAWNCDSHLRSMKFQAWDLRQHAEEGVM